MTREEFKKRREELLESFIEELDNDQIVDLHNVDCNLRCAPDDEIYRNDEETFNERIGDKLPFDVARELNDANYNIHHDYFTYGEDGLVSFDDPLCDESPVYISDILDRSVDDVIDLLDDAHIKHLELDWDLDDLETEYKKSVFQEQWDKMFADKAPMLSFPNDDYCYINYNQDNETLETGSVCNAGFCRSSLTSVIDIDYDETLEYNLDGLYEKVVEEHPDLNESPEE